MSDIEAARSDQSHLTIFDQRSGYHVGCKLVRSPDEISQVRDAKDVALAQGRLRVARAEDTIAFKVSFGSPQDLRDVRGILVRQQGRLDVRRLRALARRLGVAAKLEEAMREAGLG